MPGWLPSSQHVILHPLHLQTGELQFGTGRNHLVSRGLHGPAQLLWWGSQYKQALLLISQLGRLSDESGLPLAAFHTWGAAVPRGAGTGSVAINLLQAWGFLLQV